ncbi:SGNH/GDSL hydrolase family protein [Caryophanon latum]|uniref:SGNH hydrolase-type esterase domain-containing protein n=1 Tax=Caryophanon latum TaxID=33977 RepID=A0A1C0YW23_9BACL|nr:SGNH/GDSL hydrolase family protein [Caryophanon latum]OCS91376.1 hypothetical protein A6K76_09360 [Caryophanon latum]
MKRVVMIVSMFMLLAFPIQAAERYVSLGDSLAAGQTPNSMIDAGYSDFIALRLASRGELAHFTKELAFSGFTTEQVLQRVKEPFAQPILRDATLITISAGANDLLRLVNANNVTGDVTFDQFAADFALNNVRENTDAILKELKLRAPNASVAIIGYYFPYPHVHNAQKEGLSAQLATLNTILQQQAESNGATFVSVDEAFGLDATHYLPNPTDVHPNFDGYMAMANAFLSDAGISSLTRAELPAENSKTFEEVLQQLQAAQTKVTAEATSIKTIERYVPLHGVAALKRIYVLR